MVAWVISSEDILLEVEKNEEKGRRDEKASDEPIVEVVMFRGGEEKSGSWRSPDFLTSCCMQHL